VANVSMNELRGIGQSNVIARTYRQDMHRLVGVGLLASAFAPMVAVIAILRFHQLGPLVWIVLAVCALAVLLLALVLRQVARIQQRSIAPKQVKRVDDKVLAFASTYIVSLRPPEVADDHPR